MKRIALVVVSGLVGLPLAATAKMHPAPSAETPTVKMEDCAAYFRSKVPLPEKMAELQANLADGLEMHIKWQSRATDKASRAELAFLRKVVREHRALSASFKRLAALLGSASFPPAPHDMSRMDARAGESMAKQAALERQFAELLTKNAGEIDKMLGSAKGMAKAAR